MKRNPVNFPRMKVRGARNHFKSAVRHTTTSVIPYAKMEKLSDTSTRFIPQSEPGPGLYRIEHRITKDGWGRTVPTPEPPKPKPETPALSMQFEMAETEGVRDLFNLLMGRKEGAR